MHLYSISALCILLGRVVTE